MNKKKSRMTCPVCKQDNGCWKLPSTDEFKFQCSKCNVKFKWKPKIQEWITNKNKSIVFSHIPTIQERERKERMDKYFKEKAEAKKAKQRELLKIIDFLMEEYDLCDSDITNMSRYENPIRRN